MNSEITYLVNEIAKLTNQATSKEQAIKMGLDKYLFVEYASVYGGYRLVNVNVNNGGHSGSFLGSSTAERLSKKYFMLKLNTCLDTILYCKTQNY